jgi:hypothetical protein
MMDNTNDILLKKLVAGNITKAEQRKLEIAALEDPFLFDAIEGYSKTKSSQNRYLVEIENRIDKSLKKPKERYNYNLLGLIAAVVFIAVSIFVFRNILNGKSESPPIAKEMEQNKEEKSTSNQTESIIAEVNKEIKDISVKKIEHKSKQNIGTNESKSRPNDIEMVSKKAENVNAVGPLYSDAKTDDTEILKDGKSSAEENGIPKPSTVSKADLLPEQRKSFDSEKFILSGKILNESGDALVGINVITDEKQTLSGIDGRFEIALTNKKHFVVFADSAYEPTSIYAFENNDVNIFLKGITKFDKDNKAPNFKNFEDEIDENFLKYLEQKKLSILGEITVYFKVSNTGVISDIVVYNCTDFVLQDNIIFWTKKYEYLLPKDVKDDVIKMVLFQ